MKKMFLSVLVLLCLVFSASAVGDITISPSTDSAGLNISQSIKKTVTITNGNLTDNLTVILPSAVTFVGTRNNPTIAIAYSQNSGLVANNTNIDINYTFTAPNVFSDVYTGVFNFNATLDDYDALTFTLTINPSPSLTINDISKTIVTGQSSSSALTLNNNGNTDLTASLAKTDLISTSNSSNTIPSSNIVLGEPILNVRYGGSNSTQVTISVPSGTPAGAYKGNITATYGGKKVISTVTVTVQSPNYALSLPSSLSIQSSSRNKTVSTTFTITNSGNLALTGINATSDANSKYQVNFSSVPATLAAGSSNSVTLVLFIPVDEATTAHSIGKVYVKADNNATGSFDLVLDVAGKLSIEDLDVVVGGKRHSDISNGDTIKEDAAPGDEVKFDFDIKNEFTDDEDIEIRDITIKVTIKDIDLGDDIDEESDEFDINADNSEDVSVTLTVPTKVKEDNYDVIIDINGKDENGVKHSVSWTLDLRVDKKSHDNIIKEAKLDDEILDCSRNTNLKVKLINMGTNDEDEIVLEAKNKDIGLDFSESGITLNEDPEDDANEYDKTIPVNVGAKLKAGTYPIAVKVYYNEDILDDTKTVNLVVKDCVEPKGTTEETKEETPEEKVEVIVGGEGTTGTTVPILPEKITTTKETPFTESMAYFILLAGAAILVVLIILIVVAKAAVRKE